MALASPQQPRPGSVLEPDGPGEHHALDVMDHVLRDPAAALPLARAQLATLEEGSHLVRVLANRALAVALREAGELDEGLRHAERAVELASTAGPPLRAEAMYTLALTLLVAGDGPGASRLADSAVDLADGHDLLHARTLVHRALVRHRLGTNGWLDDYDLALPVLAAHGDMFWEGLARLNRGNALVYLGRIAEGRSDLERVLALADVDAPADTQAFARHNLGFAATRGGDLPAALAAFDAAEEPLRRIGFDIALVATDRAEALLAAGLVDEAVHLLRDALPSLADSQPIAHAEALLLLARSYLDSGRLVEAATVADEAVAAFRSQGRHGWARMARAVAALAGLALHTVLPLDGAEIAADATGHGWHDVAGELLAGAALAAAGQGDLDLARRLVDDIDEPAEGLPLATRLAAAHARMAVAEGLGDGRTVLAVADEAMAHLEDRRVLLGASELRVHVARLAQDVTARAARTALAMGDLDVALAWVDRVRSQALDRPPVVPPDDPELAADLGRLRLLADDLQRRRASGEPVEAIEDQRTDLERRVQARTRTASGHGRTAPELGTRATGTVEVAWLDLDGRLAALVADDDATRRVDLDLPAQTVMAEIDALGFAMQRVGGARAPGRRRDLAARSLEHSLAQLDELLVAPLGLRATGPVVVSPTSVLHDVPWSGLPSLRGRGVAVAPSLRLARRPARDDAGQGTVLLEGPRLAHARAELETLVEVVTDPRSVLGPAATVAAARDTLPGAAVAHLACHGVFRADSPQFSSLELADGPMFVYDLEALPRVPPLIVLSACQTGRSAVHAGDELLGVTASLLAMGARTVVAALADVPDDLSAHLMVAFHRAVADGQGPADALAEARTRLLSATDDPAALLTAAAFLCVGAP